MIKKLCLKILGIKENPFLRICVGYNNGNYIYVYTGREGQKIINDKLDLWPKGISGVNNGENI